MIKISTMNNSEAQSQNKTPQKKNYTALWVMMFLFVLPYIAAFYFYFNRDELDLGKTSNYGNIVNPAKPMPDTPLVKIDGTGFKLSSLRGKWVLLSIGSSTCKKDCLDNLYKIRQIKKAVGQEHKRISKLFFLTDKKNINSFRSLLKDYPNMDVVIPSGDNYNDYLLNFKYKKNVIKDGIYVIDPLGNYMMMYPEGADASKILKDIERLLKVSKIG